MYFFTSVAGSTFTFYKAFKLFATHKINALIAFSSVFIFLFNSGNSLGQTYSSSASLTGSVTSAGIQNSNLNGIETVTPRRGWFKFNISAIPVGSTINTAVLNYPTASGTVNSGSLANQLNALLFDPLTITSGIDLYTFIGNGAPGVNNLFTGSWSGSHPLALNTNGPTGGNAQTSTNLITYIQNMVNAGSSYLAYSLVRGSTNNYNFSLPSLTINYTLPPPCIDPPAGGNAGCQPNPACPSVIRTFSLSSSTFGFGQLYQWQSSPDNISWTNIAGATQSQYLSAIATQTYLRCEVTCGSGTDVSSSVLALVDNYLTCYCVPLYGNGCGSGDAITNVNIPSTVLNNSTGCTGPPHFSFYNSQIPSLIKGNAYTLSVSFGVDPNQFCAAWIDMDHSGSFEQSELIASSSSTAGSNGTATFNFSVPVSALSGQTRMRIRGGDDVAITPGQSCGATNSTFGETEDYLIDLVSPSNCIDPPIAGTITGPSSLCNGTSGSLVASGYTQGTILQWQSASASGGPYTDIIGETNPILNITATAPVYYRLAVTCVNTDFTPGFFVDLSSSVNCLCPSIHQNGCTLNDEIANVSIDVLNNSSGCSPGAYTFYNSGLPIPSLAKTVSYSLAVTFGSDPNQYFGAWIDYNQNGSFENSEFIGGNSVNAGSGGTALININISGSSLTGLTALRIIGGNDFPLTSSQGCGYSFSSWGETEDYLVTIASAPPCTDPPVAGIISGDLTSCPGNSAVLNLNGFSVGTIVQWQQSPDGISWNDIAGANSSLYITNPLFSDTWFRSYVTCVNSDTSQAVQVTIDPYLNCYCTDNLHTSSCGNGHIVFASINQTTLNNLSGCSFISGVGAYSSFPASGSTTATLLQSVTYNITVQTDNNQGPTSISLWIDYNHSGTFDSLEWTEIATFNNNATVSFTIPAMALNGQTGMRIRSRFSGNPNGASNACSSFGSGETEDYIITIDPAPVCIDPPAAGTITGNPGVCSGDQATLTLTGYTLGTTLQWQQSSDGIIWNDIAGATNPNFITAALTDTAFFRVIVSCIASDTSAPIQVNINPFYQCYCQSGLNPVACGNGHITNVEVLSTALSNPSGCFFSAGPGAYSFYPATGSTTATLLQSVPYTFNVQTDNAGGPTIVSVWIDFNRNGSYETTEWTQVYTADNNNSVTITIPNNAITGLTGMRVRSRFAGNNNFSGDACTSFNSGETEDYIITIDTAPPCADPPVSGTILGNFGVCSGSSTTLTLSGATPGTFLQWQFSSNGSSWTDMVTNGNNTSYIVLGLISPTYYRVKVTCLSDVYTQPVLVSIVPCITMTNGNDTTCVGNFYDSGGQLSNYSNNSNLIYTIYPDPGNQMQITFSSFALENGEDFLKIYDGNSTGSPLIGPAQGFSGTISPGTITSTAVDGSLTFEFTSDAAVNFSGWEAVLNCVSSACSGTPDAGTVIQPVFNCINESTTIIASGASGSAGIIYQWEESDDNGVADPWTSISGASSISYITSNLPAAKWYRIIVLCTISSLADTSLGYQVQFKPSPLPVALSNSPICEGNDIILSASNNAPGQSTGNSFSWSGPLGFTSNLQSPAIVNSVQANGGTYIVVITNQFSCSASASANAVVVNPAPSLFVALQTNVSCNGGSDGMVDLDASLGTPPFVFSDGSGFNLDGIFSGLPANVYFFTVTDSNNCPGDLTVTITEPPPTTVANAGIDQSICNDSTALSANTPISGSGYWSLISGSAVINNPSSPNTVVTNLGSGNNTFRWTIFNSICNDSTFDDVVINAGNSPVATISGNQNICSGNQTALTFSFTGVPSWTFSYTDGTTIYGPITATSSPHTINVTPLQSAIYSLINVFGPAGCQGTVQGMANIIVSTAPPSGQTQSLSGIPDYACAGTVAIIGCSPVINAVEYIWDAPAGSYFDGIIANVSPYSTTSPSVQITFGAPNGSGYLVCVKPSNGCGTAVQRCQWIRGITSVPTSVSGPLIACPNTTQLYSTGNVTGATGYSWYATGGISIISGNGTQNVSVSFSSGFTTGTLCVSATTSCYTSPAKCITISNTASNLGAFTGPNKVCPGSNPINYQISAPPGISSFVWSLPSNSSGSSTSNSINVTYNSGFSYGLLCVTGYSICNVPTSQKCLTISTGVPSTPPAISGPSNTVCSQNVVYTCPSVQGASSYTWTVPASATILSGNGTNAINVLYGSANPLTGQVCVVSGSTCIGTSAPRCITVKGAPNPPGPITTSQTTICPWQDAVDFSIPVLTGNVSYSWLVPAGSVIVTGQGSASILADMGTTPGNVIATAYNNCGNASATYYVSLVCPRIANGSFNSPDYYATRTLMAMPNPSTGSFDISFNSTIISAGRLLLSDIYGRMVYTKNINLNGGVNIHHLNFEKIDKGIYLLSVEPDNHKKETIRIIIE